MLLFSEYFPNATFPSFLTIYLTKNTCNNKNTGISNNMINNTNNASYKENRLAVLGTIPGNRSGKAPVGDCNVGA